jgi:hypothetical protein
MSSGLPLKADIAQRSRHVSKVPRNRHRATPKCVAFSMDGQGACPTSIEADASISGRKLQAWAEWEGHEHFVIVFPANL